ncbi:MAG: hypothetical protein KGL39_39045 [Patescibacteria group bacterium]|nr:hypothetical protein [Patescibacteria group bacterium]
MSEMSSKAYRAFIVYRDLGPSRSLKEAAQLCGTVRSTLERWSAQHEWVRLVADHDRQTAIDTAVATRNARVAEAQQVREDRLARARRIRDMGLEALERLHAEGLITGPTAVAMVHFGDEVEAELAG